MALTLRISNAAHAYGLDNYSAFTGSGNAAKLGQLSGYTSSFGDNPVIGQASTITLNFSGGFTADVLFTIRSAQFADITAMTLRKGGSNEALQTVSGFIGVSTASLTNLSDSTLFFGADTLVGNNFNNILQGWGGADRIDGGAGVDTAVFSGLRSQSTVVRTTDGSLTVTGPDGADTLVNVERLKFSNTHVALDTAGNGGQAYRLYQAAFNRTPEAAGLGFQIHAMDSGLGLKQLAQNFLNSPEFSRSYGSLDNTAFITRLYRNVLHRGPDAAGLAYHANDLATGASDRAQLLANFSESQENQAALIGSIQNGMAYTL